jgi:hypothetical protein
MPLGFTPGEVFFNGHVHPGGKIAVVLKLFHTEPSEGRMLVLFQGAAAGLSVFMLMCTE